jgi:hypothetical protein
MEEGKIKEVIEKLKYEQEIAPKHEGLEACIRYMNNRPGQFDYLRAREKELPIDSGKVERYSSVPYSKKIKDTWRLVAERKRT